MDNVRTISISQFPVKSTTQDRLADHLLTVIAERRQAVLFFANTNLVVKGRFLLEHTADPSLLLVNDGVGLDIAAKLLHGTRFDSNLNGTDFTPYLFRRSTRPLKVFMIGGKPEVLTRAAAHVGTQLGQQVVGAVDGYGGMRDGSDLVQRINDSGAEVLLVAMGNPLQERWIMEHRAALRCNVLMGVGALFDFWAGDKPRAPALVQRLRLEWLYRLSLEPRRLLRRYTWDILVFLRLCFKHR